MKRSTRAAIAALTGVTALALAGCTGQGATPTPSTPGTDTPASAGGTVAFSAVSLQIPLVVQLGDMIKGFFTEQGFDYQLQDAAFDPAKQAQQLTQALDNGSIAAAWVFPVSAAALAPTIKHAQEKKVPIVLEGSPSDIGLDGPQPGVIFSSPDVVAYGTAIGEGAAQCIADKKIDNAQVFFLNSPAVAAGADVVRDTILDSFKKKAPTATIVADFEAKDITEAQTQTQQQLIAHPDVTVVIAGNDESALGAIGSFKAAGKKPACLVSGGGNPNAVDAQKAGDITTLVAWDYTEGINKVGNDLLRLIKDPTAEGGIFQLPIKILK